MIDKTENKDPDQKRIGMTAKEMMMTARETMMKAVFSKGSRCLSSYFLVAICLIYSSWVFWSCKDDIPGTEDIVFPKTNVSYGRYVQPLFDRGCAFSGCHGPDTFEARGYSLDSYQHATARVGIIVYCFPNETCNTESSLLIRRIEGLDNLPRMPLYRPALTQNQIDGMKQWMREGAQNN